MKIGEIYQVTIEKLTNLGLGLARVEGFVVFVPNSCTDDVLKIKITKLNKKYANAQIVEIVKPSEYRVQPFCPLQKVCGACQIQFIDYEYQLKIKQQIVKETLYSIGKFDLDVPFPVKSPEIVSYRHKIQYPVTQTKNSKRLLAGYYKSLTHEMVNIKYCPIQPRICDTVIEFIKENARKFDITGYCEKSHSGLLRHVVIRNSAFNEKNLVTLVINDVTINKNIVEFAQFIYDNFEKVIGVCVNLNNQKTNVILGANTVCICGNDYIEERILDKNFKIGAETFFQINPKSAENIFKYVCDYIKNNFEKPLVLDAYAGISAFGICVSDVAHKVVSIEENLKSVEFAKESAELNNVANIEIHGGDAAEFFKSEERKFDVIILDPPRKGCTPQSLDETLRLSRNTIIYVSCNPATLARDLKYLCDKGCKIKSVQPFDMFCHTYHIENVAIIEV